MPCEYKPQKRSLDSQRQGPVTHTSRLTAQRALGTITSEDPEKPAEGHRGVRKQLVNVGLAADKREDVIMTLRTCQILAELPLSLQ